MKLKKILAATLLSGGLTVGTVAIASTASADTPTRLTQEQLCHRAQHVWQRLKYLDERARAHQQNLTALRDKAATEGNTELAARIEVRLARLQERHDRVVARLTEIREKANGRCATGDAGSDPTTTDPATTAS